MLQTDASNTIFTLAANFVHNTTRHIFITGKAGTGKTTFLRHIKEQTQKRAVVIAPTGVAAINAGGVTMHSFFQLPFGPFIPGHSKGFSNIDTETTDKHSLFKNIWFTIEKRELLQELELLIIDEVSMVRADMLDAIDLILRHFRKKLHLPFGGVQVVYIGDMYQLPPVVPNEEWQILQDYYQSPFFFSAKVIEGASPLYIELKKIYRQSDQVFIEILNRVRNNQLTATDFLLLNQRYQANYQPPKEEKNITLCTHNKKADAINASALENLPGKLQVFNGTVEGDFSEKALPTEMSLRLKEGAQVMFIKNDSGGDRRYYNGKLATISSIEPDKIIVTDNNNNEQLTVEKETWRNIRYNYDKESDRIKEEELGSFTQYPIRLAWAITIHKSQGLTFDRAIIDAGASFAPGQVYVALSRCTSLEGMTLLSKLSPTAIATDKRVIAFAQKEAAAEELEQLLAAEEQQYRAGALIKQFNYDKITTAIEQFRELVPGKKLPDVSAAVLLAETLFNKAGEQARVATRFQLQLQHLLQETAQSGNSTTLQDRVSRGIHYFVSLATEELLRPLQQYILPLQHSVKSRKYVKEIQEIELQLIRALQKMIHASYGEILFCKNPETYQLQSGTGHLLSRQDELPVKKAKIKGSSQAESLALFKEGNTVAAIASMRQLAENTVLGHLSGFISSGEIDIHTLVPEERLTIILNAIKDTGAEKASPIKDVLDDSFSYGEIRMALSHWQWIQQEKVNA